MPCSADMPKTILVTVRRNPANTDHPTYDVAVLPRPMMQDLRPGNARAPTPGDAIESVAQMLAPIFEDGDVIEFGNVDYKSVAGAVAAVRVAQVDWA